MEEWKRILNRKMLLLIVAVFVLNVCLYVNQQATWLGKGGTKGGAEQYKELLETYAAGTVSKEAYEQAITENDTTLHSIKSGRLEGNYEGCVLFQEKLQHLHDFPEQMEQIQVNAQRLTQFSIFSDTNSFAYHNIIKTGKDFAEVAQAQVRLENDLAAESVKEAYVPFLLAFALILVLIYQMNTERESAVWDMIYAAGNGRIGLAGKRIGLLVCYTFFMVFGLFFENVAAAYILYGGVDSLFAPVQQLIGYEACAYQGSVLQYFFYECLVAWFFLLTLASLVWSLFLYMRNRNIALFFVCGFTGLEYLLYTWITTQSVYAVFRYINVWSLLHISELLRVYRNWKLFGTLYTSATVLLVLSVMAFFLCICLIIAAMQFQKPHKSVTRAMRCLKKWSNRIQTCMQSILSGLSVTGFESVKILFTARGLLILCIVFVVSAYFCVTSQMHFSQGMQKKDAMYLEQGGKDYTQLRAYTEQIQQDYAQAADAFADAGQRRETGDISDEEYYAAGMRYQEARSARVFAAEFIEKIEYLDALKEDGIDGYLMSDRGYEEVFGVHAKKREMILLLAVCMGIALAISKSMSLEYDTRMSQIVRSAKNGRRAFLKQKILAGGLIAGVTFLAVYAADYGWLNHYYGFPYLEAPVRSLLFMREQSTTLCIWVYLLIKLLGKLGIVCFVVGFSFVVSLMVGKTTKKNLEMAALVALVVVVLLYGQISFPAQNVMAAGLAIVGMGLLVFSMLWWDKK